MNNTKGNYMRNIAILVFGLLVFFSCTTTDLGNISSRNEQSITQEEATEINVGTYSPCEDFLMKNRIEGLRIDKIEREINYNGRIDNIDITYNYNSNGRIESIFRLNTSGELSYSVNANLYYYSNTDELVGWTTFNILDVDERNINFDSISDEELPVNLQYIITAIIDSNSSDVIYNFSKLNENHNWTRPINKNQFYQLDYHVYSIEENQNAIEETTFLFRDNIYSYSIPVLAGENNYVPAEIVEINSTSNSEQIVNILIGEQSYNIERLRNNENEFVSTCRNSKNEVVMIRINDFFEEQNIQTIRTETADGVFSITDTIFWDEVDSNYSFFPF